MQKFSLSNAFAGGMSKLTKNKQGPQPSQSKPDTQINVDKFPASNKTSAAQSQNGEASSTEVPRRQFTPSSSERTQVTAVSNVQEVRVSERSNKDAVPASSDYNAALTASIQLAKADIPESNLPVKANRLI